MYKKGVSYFLLNLDDKILIKNLFVIYHNLFIFANILIYHLYFWIMVNLEEVFKDSGIPTYTFVEPNEYSKIVVSLRTRGRCLIVEGPSGIGKTTCVLKVLESLHFDKDNVELLSARKLNDRSRIDNIINDNACNNIAIIDDFHLLPNETKEKLASLMKVIADEERDDMKLVLIGINRAGDSLIKISPDLNNRVTTVKFEVNPENKIMDLISKGEKVLNVDISCKQQIVKKANGSFHIAQMICKELCIQEGVLNSLDSLKTLNVDINYVIQGLMKDLSRVFDDKAKDFAVGTRLRSGGRAPYFHLLKWLSDSQEWSIRMSDVYLSHPTHKASISQVVEKGYLVKLISSNDNIQSVIHYDDNSKTLTVEDPKFIFYLQNINWDTFASKIGFSNVDFVKNYDFAISFAGEVRTIAAKLVDILEFKYSCSVFYDYNEQHRILGEDLSEYFEPIYKSDADYIIVLVDKNYPKKLWTNFESDRFKERFGEHAVIPILFKGCEPTQFDPLFSIGNLMYDHQKDMNEQLELFAKLLYEKLNDKRMLKID